MRTQQLKHLEKEIAELTLEELHETITFIMEASDDDFSSAMERRIAAEYVLQECNGRMRGDVGGLRDWIHTAVDSYSGFLRNVANRTTIRAAHGQSDELVASGY